MVHDYLDEDYTVINRSGNGVFIETIVHITGDIVYSKIKDRDGTEKEYFTRDSLYDFIEGSKDAELITSDEMKKITEDTYKIIREKKKENSQKNYASAPKKDNGKVTVEKDINKFLKSLN